MTATENKLTNLLKNEEKPRNLDVFQLQHPFRAISAGKSGSGKTTWILKNILLAKNQPFDKIIWCAPKFSLEQAKLQEVKKKLKSKLVLVEGLDKELLQDLIDKKPKREQWLIVLDDLLTKTDDPFISDLFTAGRHKNISTIEILQRIYAGKSGRTHRLNSDYFLLCDFPDKSEIRSLFRQIDPKHVEKLMECYTESVGRDQGHGCMVVDQKWKDPQTGAGLLKYRDNNLDQGWVLN